MEVRADFRQIKQNRKTVPVALSIIVKKRILFVGEDQPLWQEFERFTSEPNSPWSVEFARTAPEALALIERINFDAAIVDEDLADVEGVDLLDRIMQGQPKMLRLILSDLENATSTVKCVGRAHQHLLKPCDAFMISHALNQALTLQAWLPSEAVYRLVSRMRWLPSPPGIYTRILAEMRSMDTSIEKVGELIAQDPAVSAKVLQLANSAVFALQLEVVQPAEAVSYVGLETTKALVLLAHTFSSFARLHVVGFSAEALWRHSVAVGHIARQIATSQSSGPELAEQSFSSGLLHDIGKLLLAANLAEPFGQALALAKAEGCALWEAESQVFGATHAELGACLLGIWGLPTPVVKAVALHHDPSRSTAQAFSPLTAVHAANVFEHEFQPGPAGFKPPTLDVNYLNKLGLAQRAEEWRQECSKSNEAAAA